MSEMWKIHTTGFEFAIRRGTPRVDTEYLCPDGSVVDGNVPYLGELFFPSHAAAASALAAHLAKEQRREMPGNVKLWYRWNGNPEWWEAKGWTARGLFSARQDFKIDEIIQTDLDPNLIGIYVWSWHGEQHGLTTSTGIQWDHEKGTKDDHRRTENVQVDAASVGLDTGGPGTQPEGRESFGVEKAVDRRNVRVEEVGPGIGPKATRESLAAKVEAQVTQGKVSRTEPPIDLSNSRENGNWEPGLYKLLGVQSRRYGPPRPRDRSDGVMSSG